MRTNAAVALVLLAGLGAEAAAQVVTPPPAPKPKEEYTPPAEREPARTARPAQTAQAAEPEFDPASVEFEPIYTRTESGDVVPTGAVVEIEAIRANPLIDDDIRIIIDELIAERATRAESVVVANPDAAIDFGLGVVGRMDFADRTTVEEVADVAQKLQMGDGVIADLSNQGVLTEQARLMSVHIWQDYNRAVTASLAEKYAEAEDPNAMLNAQSQFLMGVSMQEIGAAFDRVARRALNRLDSPEAEQALELESDAFREAAGAILDRLDSDRLAEVFK